jgi:hypothetical protein
MYFLPDSRLSVRPRRDYWQNGRNGVVFAPIPEMMQISTLLQISASGDHTGRQAKRPAPARRRTGLFGEMTEWTIPLPSFVPSNAKKPQLQFHRCDSKYRRPLFNRLRRVPGFSL